MSVIQSQEPEADVPASGPPLTLPERLTVGALFFSIAALFINVLADSFLRLLR